MDNTDGPLSQRGKSMERVGFLIFFFTQSHALGHCVGCFVFTLFRDALWTGEKGECGCQGFVTWRLTYQILGT